MNIYFACSITGGREFQPVYRGLVEGLLSMGHEVPTAQLAGPGLSSEAVLAPRVVYERDTAWIRACDALIAEVSVPSHGVGYEIAFALEQDKPVLCLCRAERPLSKMISGNPHSDLHVFVYEGLEQALNEVSSFLSHL